MDEAGLEAYITNLKAEYRGKRKKTFLDDIYGQIVEDDIVREHMFRPHVETKKVVVTFDKMKNDTHFDYSLFDVLLVIIDQVQGGSGLKKPLNQLRVLQWNGTRGSLLKVLLYFRRYNRALKFRRLLVLPYPRNVTGNRLDANTYMK